MKHIKSLLFTILIALLATGSIILMVFLVKGRSGEDSGGFHSPTYFAMDTTLEITIQGRDEKLARRDVGAALQLVRKVESYTSRFKKGSDVWLINEKAGSSPVKVHPETIEIVERSLELSQMTGGAFDITVAPIVRLWGFYDQEYRVPTQQEIDLSLIHISEPTRLGMISYAVFCLKKKKKQKTNRKKKQKIQKK